jgi:hypothetical protein
MKEGFTVIFLYITKFLNTEYAEGTEQYCEHRVLPEDTEYL